MSNDISDLQLLQPTELMDADRLHNLGCCCGGTTNIGTEWCWTTRY
ncbi:hypothetical protein [Streptomyces armeniacus]|nr:hypothetical protein [Streptomyces armeniacus]